MSPRSSMQTRRFTRTLRRASCRVPVARLVLTTAGSSCGVMPTAIARENSRDSITGRCSSRFATKMSELSPMATCSSRKENRLRPSWNSVCGCRSPRPSAIRPNSARPPVATTTAVQLPDWSTVPMKTQLVRSASGASCGTGAGSLATGSDSPVRMLSSHRRSLAVSTRMSAGMIAPIPRWTTSPGTSAVTSISPGLPSRTTTARCVTRECKASAARSARYSLLNPSPTLTSRITPMTIAFVASPRNSESPAVMSRRSRMGLASCRPSTDHPLAMWVRTAFGPISVRRLPASAPVSPFPPEPSSSNTAATGRPAARAIASGAEGKSLTSSSGIRNPFATFRLRHSLCPGRTVQEPSGPEPCVEPAFPGCIYSPGTVLQRAVGLFFDPAAAVSAPCRGGKLGRVVLT